jgi:hypothetical protein
MLGIPDGQLRLQLLAHCLLGSTNSRQRELWANLWPANFCITLRESVRAACQCVVIAVLEGSGEERYDLWRSAMISAQMVALFLVELGELVLKYFVEITAYTTIWSGKVVVWRRVG